MYHPEGRIRSGLQSLRVFNDGDLSATVAPKPACHEDRSKVRQTCRRRCGTESMRRTHSQFMMKPWVGALAAVIIVVVAVVV